MSLLEQLRSGREAAGRGGLTLDRAKAREKMRMFRLPDPHFYVVQFVRAARILGATLVHFEISLFELTCQFEAAFDEALLADFWSAAFLERSDDATRAIHCLALGVGSAQALAPASIQVDSGRVSLRLTEAAESFGPRDGDLRNTVIRVRDEPRMSHVADFFSELLGESAEARALRQACRRAPFYLYVNGERINRDDVGIAGFGRRFESEDAEGWLVLDRSLQSNEVALHRDGVLVGYYNPPVHGIPMRCGVASKLFQTDLSGLALRPGSEPDVVAEHVIPQYHGAVRQWFREAPPDQDAARELVIEVLEYTRARQKVGKEVSEQTLELVHAVLGTRLFHTATKPSRPIALTEFIGNVVRYSRRPSTTPENPGAPVLLLKLPGTQLGDAGRYWFQANRIVSLLADCGLYRTVDDTLPLTKADHAATNRATWASHAPREGRQWQYGWRGEGDGVRGGVYLPLWLPTEPPDQVAQGGFLHHKARLLRWLETDHPLGVWLDVDAEPNASWDDIVRDERVDEFAVELSLRAFDVIDRFAREESSFASSGTAPRVVDQLLLLGVAGRLPHVFLELLGYELPRRVQLITAVEGLRRMWIVEPDARGDLENLGALLHVPTFDRAGGTRATLAEILDQPRIVSALRPDDVQRMILRVLSMDPSDTGRTSGSVEYEGDASRVRPRVSDGRPPNAPLMPPPPAKPPALSELVAPTPADPPSPSGSPSRIALAEDAVVDDVLQLLIAARGRRRDLLDDHLATHFRCGPLSGRVCEVSEAGVTIDPAHVLVERARAGDQVDRAVLASVVYSRINAWYATIADHQELELQRRLMQLIPGEGSAPGEL